MDVRESEGEYDRNQDANLDGDHMKSSIHTGAGIQLVIEGIAPNEVIGRIFVQFVAISDGKDIVDWGRDIRRLNFI